MPANLQPLGSDGQYFCTDEKGGESIAITYRENKECHAQLKTASSHTDWSTVIVAGVVSLLLGYAIGASK